MEKFGNVLSWAVDLEDEARQQAINTASLPFVQKPVALMPDAHFGMGATVGSVIATQGAIIPAAVGVDIGCFVGDTKIPLLDGTQETLRNLVGREPFLVYSLNAEQEIVAGLATAHLTRKDAKLMKVIVSGGEEIICTPDHQFMLRDGTYKEAKDLKFNDSLMPLYRKWSTRDGYEGANTGSGDNKMTHIRVWEQFNGPVPKGHVVHHKNICHFDNRIENLMLMTKEQHSSYHRSAGHSFDNSDPEFQEKRRAGIQSSKLDSDITAQRVAVGTANITKYMDENHEEWLESVAGNGERGALYLAKANVTPKICDDCGTESKNLAAHRWHKQREHSTSNHKVIRTEFLSITENVYCLNVPEFGNFALAAGVFVHNCGMIAVRLNLTSKDLPEKLGPLHGLLRKGIPSGVGKGHLEPTNQVSFPTYDHGDLTERQERTAREQLGTLGSGNHFVELCLDEKDRVWLVLHSGSRGIGNQLAKIHIDRAKGIMKEYFIDLPDPDLAYLPQAHPAFKFYLDDLMWAQKYAMANRSVMMSAAVKAVKEFFPDLNVKPMEHINCHHNFTEMENHYGKNVWITRKGAIKADKGDKGIIPGSMGTASYIVQGLGNPASYNSCSHGAGRRMSRKRARAELTVASLVEAMDGKTWDNYDAKTLLDEHPMSYKDIDAVMDAQKDLVTIKHTLHQVLNYKGV